MEGQTLQIDNSCQLDLSSEIVISEKHDTHKKEERVNHLEKFITELDEELMDTRSVVSSGLMTVPINENISREQLSNTFSVGSLNCVFAMTEIDLDTSGNGEHLEEQIKSDHSDQKETCVIDGGGRKTVELMEEKYNLADENVNIQEISEVDSFSKKELEGNKWECTSEVQSEVPVFWTGLGTDRTEESEWETKYEKTELSGLYRGQSHIEEHLKRNESPLIGLEYIVEVWEKQWEKFQRFECMICSKAFDENNILQHLTEINHKILYLEKHIPQYVRKFPVGKLKKMNSKYLKALEDLGKQLEKFYGRQQMYITTDSIFSKCNLRIKEVIEEGPHYSECKEILFPLDLSSSERRRLSSCPHKCRGSIRDLKCTLVKCKNTLDSKPASMSKESKCTSSSETHEAKCNYSSCCSSNAKKINNSSGTTMHSYHCGRRGSGLKYSFRNSEKEAKHVGVKSSLVEKTAFDKSYHKSSYVCHKHRRLHEERKHDLSFQNQEEAEPTKANKRISSANRKCKDKTENEKDVSMNDSQHYERDRREEDVIQGHVSYSKEKERKNNSNKRKEHDQSRSWSPKTQNRKFLESSVRHYSMVDNHSRGVRDRYWMPTISRKNSQEDFISKKRQNRSPSSSSRFNESGKNISRIRRRSESKNSSNFSWSSSEDFHFDRNISRSQEAIKYSRARLFRRYNKKEEATAGIKDVKKEKLDDPVFSFFQDLFTLPKNDDNFDRYHSKQTYNHSKELQRCSNSYQLYLQQNVDQADRKVRTSEDCEVKYHYKVENAEGSTCPVRKERLRNTWGPSVDVRDVAKQSKASSVNEWKVFCSKREKEVFREVRNSEMCDFEEAMGTVVKEYKNSYFPNLVSGSSMQKDKGNINLLYKREPYSSRTFDHISKNNKYNIDTAERRYDSMQCLEENLGYQRIKRLHSTGDNQEHSGHKRLANIGEFLVSEENQPSNTQFISTDHKFSNNARSFDTGFQELSPHPLAAARVQENKLELKILEALQKSGYSYNELSTEGLSGMYKEVFASQVASVLIKMGLTSVSDAALAGIVRHLSYDQHSGLQHTAKDSAMKEEIISHYKDTSSVERVKETLSKLGIPLSDMSTKMPCNLLKHQ
ncbi:uncharacterized protein LOC143246377 isoform X2 [Tachypleus tridentatus]